MRQRIQNARIKNYFIDILKLNPLQDVIPDYVQGNVQPVVEIDKPKCTIVRRATASNTGSATIYTTPTDKDFYLTSISLSTIKDATSTSTNSDIQVTIDGANQLLADIAGITLTAQAATMSMSFPYPIKIDRNTNILVINGTSVANIRSTGTIVGYIDAPGGV